MSAIISCPDSSSRSISAHTREHLRDVWDRAVDGIEHGHLRSVLTRPDELGARRGGSDMPTATEQARPGGVTVIMVLGILSGLLNIASGIFVIVDRHTRQLQNSSGSTGDELLAAGIVTILIGVVVILVAYELGRGSRVARLLLGIFAIINLAAGFYAAVAYTGEQRSTGLVAGVIWAVVLYLLYGSDRDRDYFLGT